MVSLNRSSVLNNRSTLHSMWRRERNPRAISLFRFSIMLAGHSTFGPYLTELEELCKVKPATLLLFTRTSWWFFVTSEFVLGPNNTFSALGNLAFQHNGM